MSQFSYSAVTREGRLTQGRLEALDQRTVTQRIQGMGLIPVSIEEVVAKSERRRIYFQGITQKDILFFTEELATLAAVDGEPGASFSGLGHQCTAIRIGGKQRPPSRLV